MSSINNKENIKTANYIEAIIDLIPDVALLKQLYNTLCSFKNLQDANLRIKALFTSLLISKEVKKEVLTQLLQEQLDHKKINYIFTILINNHDFKYLHKIIEKLFLKLLEFEDKNLMQITTATELEAPQKDKLEEVIYSLGKPANNNIYLKYQIDEEIQGGYIIHFKDKIYDDSLRRKFSIANRIINELITI